MFKCHLVANVLLLNFAAKLISSCGVPAIKPGIGEAQSFKIYGGQEAVPFSWPWMAIVRQPAPDGSGPICGGTLIDNQWILTAEHCVDKNSRNVTVWLGIHDRYKPELKMVIQQPNVFTWRKHRNDEHQNMNDIALLKLDTPVHLTNHIQPICLASDDAALVTGQHTYVITGWGYDPLKGTNPETLHEAAVEIHNEKSKCKFVNFNFINHICAGSDTTGPCVGDSGGPLMVKDGGKWVQIGVTSRGCDNYRPSTAVFMRVPHYCKWIEETVGRAVCMP